MKKTTKENIILIIFTIFMLMVISGMFARNATANTFKIDKNGNYHRQVTIVVGTTEIANCLKFAIKNKIKINSKDQAIHLAFKIFVEYGVTFFEDLAGTTDLNDKAVKLYNKIFKTNFDEQIL